MLNYDGYRQPYYNDSAPPPPFRADANNAPVAPLHDGVVLAFTSFGIAFGLTLSLAIMGAAWHRRRRMASSKHAVEAQALLAEEAHQDISSASVYLSCNRATDTTLADAFRDKLRLCRLRVVGDAADRALGLKPAFDAATLRVLRGADAFAPLVTLASLQHLASLDSGIDDARQALLAEWLAALALQDGTLRAKPLLIRPVLVGAPSGTSWSRLLTDPAYAAALRTLYASVAPVAAAAEVVDAALRSERCAPLPAHLAALSVGTLVLRVLRGGVEATPADLPDGPGEAGGAARDTSLKAFELTCRFEDLPLYLVARYLPSLLQSSAWADMDVAAS